jgi:hypothetical protein
MASSVTDAEMNANVLVRAAQPASNFCYFIMIAKQSHSMLPPLDELLDSLEDDPWREEHPFSADLLEVHQKLFDAKNRSAHSGAIRKWLQAEQPCLFGRMAAKDQIQLCILTDRDLYRGEGYVRDLIAESRLQWKRRGSRGEQHGFVIHLVSPRVARAKPSPILRDLALRLCQIYLSDHTVDVDEIRLDSLPLRVQNARKAEGRAWRVGVNFFGAQGDQRWWHDHRIPGGIAFSMNSVGHMTRTRLEKNLPRFPRLQRVAPTDRLVDFALYFAMKTIHKASLGSRPGTRLLDQDASSKMSGDFRKAALRDMAGFNERTYCGQYHTDVTVPAPYFNPAAERPDSGEHELLFTYLHDSEDSDYGLMGLGEEIPVEEVFDALGWTAEL